MAANTICERGCTLDQRGGVGGNVGMLTPAIHHNCGWLNLPFKKSDSMHISIRAAYHPILLVHCQSPTLLLREEACEEFRRVVRDGGLPRFVPGYVCPMLDVV